MRTEAQTRKTAAKSKKPASADQLIARVGNKTMVKLTLNVAGHETYCWSVCAWACDYVS